MRTNKTASHIYYELDHDVQEYTKRLLAKKILHAAQQNNAAPLSDKTAKKTAETAVFLTERLALLYELNSGFRGIRFSTFGEQPAVYTTMVQHNAPLYDELMLGRAYNLASFLAAESPDIREVVLMKHGVLAAIYNAAAHMKERTPEPGKISVQSQLFVSTAVELFDGLLSTADEPQLYGLLVSSSGRGIVRQRIFQGSGHKNSSRTYHHAAAYPPWFRDVESRYKGNREPLLPESLPS